MTELLAAMDKHESEVKNQREEVAQSWTTPEAMSYLKQILKIVKGRLFQVPATPGPEGTEIVIPNGRTEDDFNIQETEDDFNIAIASVHDDLWEEEDDLSDHYSQSVSKLVQDVTEPVDWIRINRVKRMSQEVISARAQQASPLKRAEMLRCFPPANMGNMGNIDPKDPNTWPNDHTPHFATSHEITTSHKSLQALVTEYLEGAPGKPALRDLEAKYGPHIEAVKRGRQGWKNWRSRKEGKKWCKRKAIYTFIEQQASKEAAIQGLAQKVKAMLEADEATKGDGFVSFEEPGSTIINLLIKKMTEAMPGYAERSMEAKRRSQTARQNKEVKKARTSEAQQPHH